MMKTRLCYRLLIHEQHLWVKSYGRDIALTDVEHYREEDVRECPGLVEERAVHPVVDGHPENPRPICEMCGTWVCDCGYYHRSRANRHPDVHQVCNKCGGDKGKFLAVRHFDLRLHPKV